MPEPPLAPRLVPLDTLVKAILGPSARRVEPPEEPTPTAERPDPYRVEIAYDGREPYVEWRAWSREPTPTEAGLDTYAYEYQAASAYMDWLEGEVDRLTEENQRLEGRLLRRRRPIAE